MVIINQFIFFGNQFYLVMTLSQFIDIFKVGFLFSYLAPLLIVIIGSLIKEASEEIKNSSRDGKINKEKFIKISYDKKTQKVIKSQIYSMDIKVGDYIELKEGQRVPADIVLLKNLSSEKSLFISTEQLDGETDWKHRKVPEVFTHLSTGNILNSDCFIIFERPSKEIYEFKGVIYYKDSKDNALQEPLNLENTLWSSTILKSKKVLGIVIYTGKETRTEMNLSKARNKIGILDYELNYLTKLLFGFMLLLSVVIVCFKKTNILFRIVIFFRFIVLFCGIIPISLRVNLDISKSFFQYRINNDPNIKNTIVRNPAIIEELGRISYLFTDKTGTLTKNEMTFQELIAQNTSYTTKNSDFIRNLLKDANSKNYIMNDISQDFPSKGRKSNLRDENCIIGDCIRVLALCNNVTPIKQKNNTISYQAASPDEIALVKYAEEMNIIMESRTDTNITILNGKKEKEKYEILANFPFSSETKRMGIILHDNKNDKIIFLLKGAESTIKEFVFEEQKDSIIENAESLSNKGLRTLVFAEKILKKEDYEQWKHKYHQALASMENRKENIQKANSFIEKKMHFLCVTGVEDKLQNNVENTIEDLRNAGIKIWMLTGDKVETGICISISTGILKKKKHSFMRLSLDEAKSIKNQLILFDGKPPNSHILVLDGKVIDKCLTDHEELFFKVALKAPSVVCCRCSPTQKSQIVTRAKKYIKLNQRTCAVGDGGNDVSMIQEADIGIGIVGKEGMQASLSSDFSINEFSYMTLLFLWHGRNSYLNTTTMAKFVIQRGMIISFIQCLFSTLFYFNAIALYNGMLILGYSTVYTNFPAISVLLDIDTNETNIMKFPNLYKELQKRRELSVKRFCMMVFQSIFQASVIMIGSIYIFGDNLYLKIVTVTFTELIFAEILNVFTEIKTFNRFIFLSLIGTCFTYLFSILILKRVLDVYFIFDWNTIEKILIISCIVWMPFYLFKIIKHTISPDIHFKIN